MKIRLHHILILSLVSIAGIGTASAQDAAGLPDVEVNDSEKDRLDREKIIYSPGEADTRYTPRTSTTSKDTLLVSTPPTQKAQPKIEKPVVPAKNNNNATKPQQQQPPKSDDDSILSFNFLYYIIQKYKLQDIVD